MTRFVARSAPALIVIGGVIGSLIAGIPVAEALDVTIGSAGIVGGVIGGVVMSAVLPVGGVIRVVIRGVIGGVIGSLISFVVVFTYAIFMFATHTHSN